MIRTKSWAGHYNTPRGAGPEVKLTCLFVRTCLRIIPAPRAGRGGTEPRKLEKRGLEATQIWVRVLTLLLSRNSRLGSPSLSVLHAMGLMVLAS